MNRPVLTIGTFDGVHLGHQFLLQETVRNARIHNTESLVITYPRHPLEIVHQTVFPYLLTEFSKREKLIKKNGIDKISYLNFDKKMSKMTADEFMENIIIKEYNPHIIVIGYDTHFGVNRCGTTEYLVKNARKFNYNVLELEPLIIDNVIPGSSLIRDLISAGMVDSAHKYLGYYYSILGSVVSGKKIGRTLGFPTINLKPLEENKLIPQKGVYFSCIKLGENYYYGATNIGVSPSIKSENVLEIETFLFNFSASVYNQEVELYFIEKIRDEKKFSSHQELINQIHYDVETIKQKIENFHGWSNIRGF